MPRPKNPVWKFFHKSEERKNGRQHYVATCKFCDPPFVIDGQPQRMVKHLLEHCKNVPEHIKAELSSFKNTTIAPLPLSQPLKDTQGRLLQKLNDQLNKRQKTQTKMENYADKCSSEDQKEIDQYLARAIFGSGLPLSLVEDEYFIAFCKKLRPAYELPSRGKLSNDLLNNTYKDVTENVSQHVKKTNLVCITSDGWTNSRCEPIINFMVTTPKPVFWKAMETKEKRHTGTFIAEQFDIVINEVGVDKVAAVLTDNASNMKAAHNILKAKYPNIFFLGCFAHNINLLVKNIIGIPWCANIITSVKEIVKFFKNHHVESACLARLQKEKLGKEIRLQLPGNTRWGSHHACLLSFVQSMKALQIIVFEESVQRSLDQSLAFKLVDTTTFWPEVEQLCEFLNHFTIMYKTFESDQPNLSSVFHRNILASNVPVKNEAYQEFTKRWNKLYDPAITLAYYFDPRYRGKFLPQNHTTMSYILEETSKLVNAESRGKLAQELLQYHNKSGPFECEHLWSDEAVGDPNIWWAVLQTERPVIGALASKLMSIPASSAAAERNWSHFGFIHNLKRNRLTNERVFKLVSVYSYYKTLQKPKIVDKIDEEDFIMISSDEEDEMDDDE